MIITHYLYNAFIIESGNKKIAIDPGALFFYRLKLTTLIPKSEWKGITHIFVTHGDIDHYWYADKVAKTSHASLICNESMLKQVKGKALLLGPRARGLAFTTEVEKLHTLAVDETMQLDGMSITGVKTTHGVLALKLGPFSRTLRPGPGERVGWGAIGFKIELDGRVIVNLGDTLLHEKEWSKIHTPDVLMVPIGGQTIANTMDEHQALRAVEIMRPRLVIPCHYNCPAFFSENYNPADDRMFKHEVEKMGLRCAILYAGESIHVADRTIGAQLPTETV